MHHPRVVDERRELQTLRRARPGGTEVETLVVICALRHRERRRIALAQTLVRKEVDLPLADRLGRRVRLHSRVDAGIWVHRRIGNIGVHRRVGVHRRIDARVGVHRRIRRRVCVDICAGVGVGGKAGIASGRTAVHPGGQRRDVGGRQQRLRRRGHRRAHINNALHHQLRYRPRRVGERGRQQVCHRQHRKRRAIDRHRAVATLAVRLQDGRHLAGQLAKRLRRVVRGIHARICDGVGFCVRRNILHGGIGDGVLGRIRDRAGVVQPRVDRTATRGIGEHTAIRARLPRGVGTAGSKQGDTGERQRPR